jgi:hypothetical protein
MKRLVFGIIGLSVLISCTKDPNDLPEYTPGKLTGVYSNSGNDGLYHEYKYSGNKIFDKYHIFEEIFTTTFEFDSELLVKIDYQSNKTVDLTMDSSLFFYNNDSITEYIINNAIKVDSAIYLTSSNKVVAIIKKRNYDYGYEKDSMAIEWNGDNLTKITEYRYSESNLISTFTYAYEYSEIENPFFSTNIPRIPFINNFNIYGLHIGDLMLNNSKLFPYKITITENDNQKGVFEFEFTSMIQDKPYEVRMNVGETSPTAYTDYQFEYEKL